MAKSATEKPKIVHRKSAIRRYTNPRKINWFYVGVAVFIALILIGSCSGEPRPPRQPSGTHHNVAGANQKFIFKIKTKTGGIVGGILIEAKDVFGAISKLNRRYPGCEILEVKQKTNGQIKPTIAFVQARQESLGKEGAVETSAAPSGENAQRVWFFPSRHRRFFEVAYVGTGPLHTDNFNCRLRELRREHYATDPEIPIYDFYTPHLRGG
tara:strand:+ start:4302 stop:4934 length:633 start_codon:yes stop_codon:yes gene_type:complete